MLAVFLTAEDLQALTGYKRSKDQARWLREKRIPFWLNRVGRPVVARATLEARPTSSLGAVR